MKPTGIHVKAKIDPPVWFLADKSDVRSSFALEDVATEFDIQGLELDWVGMCWDANFRREGNKWNHLISEVRAGSTKTIRSARPIW